MVNRERLQFLNIVILALTYHQICIGSGCLMPAMITDVWQILQQAVHLESGVDFFAHNTGWNLRVCTKTLQFFYVLLLVLQDLRVNFANRGTIPLVFWRIGWIDARTGSFVLIMRQFCGIC